VEADLVNAVEGQLEELRDLEKKTQAIDELHCVIDLTKPYSHSIDSESARLIFSKLLMYARTIVVLYEGRSSFYDEHSAAASRNYVGSWSALGPWGRLEDSASPFVDHGFLHCLPKSVEIVRHGSDPNGSYQTDEPESLFTLGRIGNKHSVDVSLSEPLTMYQLTEGRRMRSRLDLPVANIWLPHIGGIDVDTFVRFRLDNAEHFDLLHRALAQFVTSKKGATHASIVEIGQQLSEEVSNFISLVRSAKKQSRSALANMLIAFSAVGFNHMFETSQLTALVDVLAALLASSGMGKDRDASKLLADAQQSDYWIAWRLHTLAR